MGDLRESCMRLVNALDLPGEGAPLSASARLTQIALNVDTREAVIEADADVKRWLGLMAPAIAPWRRAGNATDRWVALACTFPSLDGCEEVIEARLETIASRAGSNEREGMYGAGKGHAARFVLSLYRRPFACGPFDVAIAMARWDAAHRKAFAAWVADPWWP